MAVSIGSIPSSSGHRLTVDAVNMYISKPTGGAPATNTAVLYLTDVFGINLTENRL